MKLACLTILSLGGLFLFIQSGRFLGESSVLDEESWKNYINKCGDFDFNVELHVDSHLFILVTPNQEGLEAGCTNLAFHALPDADYEGLMEKHVMPYDQWKESETIHLAAQKKFSDIAMAYDQADVNADGMGAYDMVLNNCGDFVKNFGANMDIKLTPEMTMSIAKKILGNEKTMEKVNENEHKDVLVHGDEDVKDEELMYRLVEMRTKDLYTN